MRYATVSPSASHVAFDAFSMNRVFDPATFISRPSSSSSAIALTPVAGWSSRMEAASIVVMLTASLWPSGDHASEFTMYVDGGGAGMNLSGSTMRLRLPSRSAIQISSRSITCFLMRFRFWGRHTQSHSPGRWRTSVQSSLIARRGFSCARRTHGAKNNRRN